MCEGRFRAQHHALGCLEPSRLLSASPFRSEVRWTACCVICPIPRSLLAHCCDTGSNCVSAPSPLYREFAVTAARFAPHLPSGFLTMSMAPAATTKTPYFAPSRASASTCSKTSLYKVRDEHVRNNARGRRVMREQPLRKTMICCRLPRPTAPHVPTLPSRSLKACRRRLIRFAADPHGLWPPSLS